MGEFHDYGAEELVDELQTENGLLRTELVHLKSVVGRLLDDALHQLSKASHAYDCPRGRDDYDCTCGLSDVKARISEWMADE